MPTKWAQAEESKKFVPEIQTVILKYLNENLGHNTIDPRRGFDLDLTIGEAIKIQETINSLREKV